MEHLPLLEKLFLTKQNKTKQNKTNNFLMAMLLILGVQNFSTAQTWNIPQALGGTDPSYIGTAATSPYNFSIRTKGVDMFDFNSLSLPIIGITPSRLFFRSTDNYIYNYNTLGSLNFKFIDSGVNFGNDNSGVTIMTLKSNAVGIGTTAPTDMLDVNGTFRPRGEVIFGNSGVNVIGNLNGRYTNSADQKIVTGYAAKLYYVTSDGSLNYDTYPTGNAGTSAASTKRFHIANDGRVAIGPDAGGNTFQVPTGYMLGVKGKVICEEVKVALKDKWPDYVFAQNYRLRSLAEVEAFITKNQHLPEIPSESELKENDGLAVSEMLIKQMQKIEELTLYLIAQSKEIQEQGRELKNLHSELENIKNEGGVK